MFIRYLAELEELTKERNRVSYIFCCSGTFLSEGSLPLERKSSQSGYILILVTHSNSKPAPTRIHPRLLLNQHALTKILTFAEGSVKSRNWILYKYWVDSPTFKYVMLSKFKGSLCSISINDHKKAYSE